MRIVNKKKFIRGISIIIIGFIMIIALIVMMIKGIIFLVTKPKEEPKQMVKQEEPKTVQAISTDNKTDNANNEILNQWNLKLVNKDNRVER